MFNIIREFLKAAKVFVEEGMHSQIIIRGFRRACQLAKEKIMELAVPITMNDPRFVESSFLPVRTSC